jgi:hypothetical protein
MGASHPTSHSWNAGKIALGDTGDDFVRVNEDRLDCHHAIRQRNCRRAAPAACFRPAVSPSLFIFSMFIGAFLNQ